MMNAHTPGPWTTNTDTRFRSMESMAMPESIGVRGPDGNFLASAFDFNRTDRDAEVEANARLIAAAPELHEACSAMRTQIASLIAVNGLSGVTLSPMVLATFQRCVEMADAALAKTTDA